MTATTTQTATTISPNTMTSAPDQTTHDVATLLLDRFVERRDVKAWQQRDGAYYPDRTKVTIADLGAHLACARTMGHYLISREDKCRVLIFDIDLTKNGVWDGQPFEPRTEFADPNSPYREGLVGQLMILGEELARVTHRIADVPVAISFSGNKGIHITAFTGSEPAADVRALGQGIAEYVGLVPLRGVNFFAHPNEEMSVEVEVFPKQDSLDGKDLGNLVRLPLGANRKSGRDSMFVSVGGDKRGMFQKMDPIAALTGTLPWA